MKVISEYGSRIWVIGLIVAVFVMILAIKTYVNYNVIEQEIEKVNDSIESINQEIAYSENFYKKYLDSDYANYFLAHKNNSLFDGEVIIRLIDTQETTIDTEQSQNTSISGSDIDLTSPPNAWKHFIKSQLN